MEKTYNNKDSLKDSKFGGLELHYFNNSRLQGNNN